MNIDVFTHIFPPDYFEQLNKVVPSLGDLDARMRSLPLLFDIDARRAFMAEHDRYSQILSLAAPPIEQLAEADITPDLAKTANDSLAAIVARYPNDFPGFIASLPLNNPEASLAEIDRAVNELGAIGVQIFSNINGKPLDLPEYKPLFAAMAAYDLPIWLHPARGANHPDYNTESESLYEIWWSLGWPYETSVAMIRIVFAGYFDQWPNLKIITHHLGGMIPFFEGRIGPGYDVLGIRSGKKEEYGALLKSLKHRPLDYFKMFYADTALFGAGPATKCGLEFFGAKNVLFATDFPFAPRQGQGSIKHTIDQLNDLSMSTEEKKLIFEGNIRRLCNIP